MNMQFEYTAIVLGSTRMIVEGKPYSFVYVGEHPEPDRMNDCRGYSIRKIPCDPVVFEQLSDVGHTQIKEKTFIMMLKQASQGRSQPHIIGVLDKKAIQNPVSSPAATANKS